VDGDAAVTFLDRTTLFVRPAWYDDAACAAVGPALFYVERGASTVQAETVCAGCPVRVQCLDFAIERRESFGVWGGLSARERVGVRLRRRRAS
jgi:WhiB family transcriptional regulator, redox-sensing transcriptional regulator